jgi:uncharacterized protein (TIGR03083 family)
MTPGTALRTDADVADATAAEYLALADLLEGSGPGVWDAPSLCAGWRTREVVAHMTMPARYPGPAFMAELEAAGGDFTRLSDTVAARDGALPVASLVADLRSDTLHSWQPPGGGAAGAFTHCVIHSLDVVESVPLARRVPDERIARVLGIVAGSDAPNVFGVDLSGLALRADDLDWSSGSGAEISGPAQALALVACGRLLPPGRLGGEAAGRFTRGLFAGCAGAVGPVVPWCHMSPKKLSTVLFIVFGNVAGRSGVTASRLPGRRASPGRRSSRRPDRLPG